MRNFPGLVRRDSGVYYVRTRVPQDLIGVLKRRELKQSLQTKDLREARRAYQRVFAELLRSINEARSRIGESVGGANPLSKDELERAVREWFFALWDRCEKEYITPPADAPSADEMLYQAKFELQELTQPDDSLRGALLIQARKLLADRGYTNPDASALADLASYIVRGLRLVNVRLIDHFENHRFHPSIDDPLFQGETTDAARAERQQAASLTIDELIARFYADPQRQSLSPKNRRGFAMAFRLLKEISGASKRAAEVSREDARRIRDLLSRLPPNSTKKFPKVPLQRVATLAVERGLTLLQRKTAENILRNLSAFFSWGVKEHYLVRNPMEGLRPLQNPKAADDQRRPFDEIALVKIFSSSVYTDEQVRVRYPGRYWVPLIGLYHGARANEICQLETTDVVSEQGVPAFRISKASQQGQVKRVKTTRGERLIPIHPRLLELGFINFVDEQRKAKRATLFPDIGLAATGYRSDTFSKWFARFQAELGLTDRRMVFHSFRHNFSDAARAADIPGEIVDEIAGWSGGKSMRRHYGTGYSIARKRAEIAKIAYPCLDALLTSRNSAARAVGAVG